MNEQQFFDYVTKFGAYQKRSMFGGIGLFQHDAMYVLVSEDRIFVRGGEELDPELDSIIERSIQFSVNQREFQRSAASRRLRDLPNMQLTLERMVKKAGIDDVETFMSLGAPEVFNKVRQAYGSDVDVKLLWKFAGAIEGIHWKLLQEPRKRQLLESCQQR
ncbi:TPA: TfoX/Sxy family DNA transformation protein [Vibrio cholerae]